MTQMEEKPWCEENHNDKPPGEPPPLQETSVKIKDEEEQCRDDVGYTAVRMLTGNTTEKQCATKTYTPFRSKKTANKNINDHLTNEMRNQNTTYRTQHP